MASGWRSVGVTTFGGPADPGTGSTGYRGDDLNQHPDSFAELGYGTGRMYLGDLPYGAAIEVRNPRTGRSMVLHKRDIGRGQGTPAYPVDLWYQAAQRLGLPQSWKGQVQIRVLGRGEVPAPAATARGTAAAQRRGVTLPGPGPGSLYMQTGAGTQAAASGQAGAAAAPDAALAAPTLSARAQAVLQRYLANSEADVLAGRMPAPVEPIAREVGRGLTMPQALPAPTAPQVPTVATPGSPVTDATRAVGGAVTAAAGAVRQEALRRTGAPYSGTHTLGNWQSDLAYDMMGRSGQQVTAPLAGRVVRVRPFRANPRFGGTNLTIDFGGGREAFFQHLNELPGGQRLRVGQQVRAGQVIGTLWPGINGGPHLHLGATTRPLLETLARYYQGGR